MWWNFLCIRKFIDENANITWITSSKIYNFGPSLGSTSSSIQVSVDILCVNCVCVLFSVHFPWRKCVFCYIILRLFFINVYFIILWTIVIFIVILHSYMSVIIHIIMRRIFWGCFCLGRRIYLYPFFLYKFWTESCRFGFDILSNEWMSMFNLMTMTSGYSLMGWTIKCLYYVIVSYQTMHKIIEWGVSGLLDSDERVVFNNVDGVRCI